MKSYDLIFSVGNNCNPAWNLRERGLQKFAYPFDSLGIDYKLAIDLLCNEFQGFFCKEDLCYIGIIGNQHTYKQSNIDIRYMHEFQNDAFSEQEYMDINNTYQRRIKRIYSHIASANKILMVCCSYGPEIDENLRIVLNKVREKFPNKQIDLLFYELNKNFDFNFKESDGLFYVKINHSPTDGDPNFWKGNQEKISEMLSRFSLNKKAIIFDIDDTLLNLWNGILEFNGISSDLLKNPEYRQKSINDFYDPDTFQNFMSVFVETDNYENLSPIDGMVCLVQKLYDSGFDLYIISAARPEYTERRRKNLTNFFGDVFKDIYCIGSFDKKEHLKKFSHYNKTIFIDDSVKAITDSIGIVNHPILFRANHEEFIDASVFVSNNPDKIIKYIERI